ncbi:MAG: acetyltransferase [Neptuniibacter sp. Phe_28]|jgi:acetyltransferase-like isoleucine patch superfamily enzyme|nr:MAG: acetyltransferase [Neptuniibacter sp. Phe_28]
MFKHSFYKRCVNFLNRQIFRLLFARSFQFFGRKVSLVKPDIIFGEEYISLGDNVKIGSMCWLLALHDEREQGRPILKIDRNTTIGRFAHIVSVRSVVIEQNVLIADKVYISDNSHVFESVDIPIINQGVSFKDDTLIRQGAWIGENVSIIGAIIGRNSVVAANSVVLSDVPDYSVVAGAPAKVIKRYDFELKKWMKVT